jgi:uncharacterized protein YbaR (Trm112 family)
MDDGDFASDACPICGGDRLVVQRETYRAGIVVSVAQTLVCPHCGHREPVTAEVENG